MTKRGLVFFAKLWFVALVFAGVVTIWMAPFMTWLYAMTFAGVLGWIAFFVVVAAIPWIER